VRVQFVILVPPVCVGLRVHWPLSAHSFSVRAMNARNRNLLRATLVASALMPATLAAAADLPLPPPLPVWTWSGFYLGGSAGAAAGTATFSDSYGPSIFGDKVNTAAFLAGLQLGYNWQVAPRWVVGLQADASYLDSNGTYTCMQASAEIVGSNCQVSPRVLASLTGRVGFLVDPLGRTLIYGKGGGAWMNSDISITPNNSFGPPTFPNAPATGPETKRARRCVGLDRRRRHRARSDAGLVGRPRIRLLSFRHRRCFGSEYNQLHRRRAPGIQNGCRQCGSEQNVSHELLALWERSLERRTSAFSGR